MLVLATWSPFLFMPDGGEDLTLPELPPLEENVFKNVKSAVGSRENPRARKDYKFNLVKDPATGTIPPDIRRRELQYAATLPRKNSDPRLKTTAEDWSSAGPYNVGGRTRAARADISNEDIILAGGVSGTIWRTTDGGREWEKVGNPQSLHSVTTLAQDTRPGKTGVWYYGTGEIQGNSARAPFAPFRGDGIFKSTDNGLTWTLLSSTSSGDGTVFNSPFQYVWRVVTNPFNADQDEVYAAIVGAIVKSTDGGSTWQSVLGQEFEVGGEGDLNDTNASLFTDIEITSNGVLYATIGQEGSTGSDPNRGVYRSTDGDSWVKITPFGWPTRYARVVLGASNANPNTVYFLIDSGDDDQIWRYTYRSGNGTGPGGSWQNLSDNIPRFGGELGDYDDQNSYNMMIKVHPVDPQTVYVGGTNLYRSTDGFSTSANTAWIGGYDTANNFEVYPNHYVDQHDLFFFPNDPDKMLSVNDGGIFITENNRASGVSWQALNNGFVTGQVYTVGFDGSTPGGYLVSGFQDNGTMLANNPFDRSVWNRFIGGDGAYCDVTKGQKYVYASFQEGQTYRFTVNNSLRITSFARVDPIGAGEVSGQEYLFVNPFVLDPSNDNIMYLCGGDRVWRNLNLTQVPPLSREKTAVNWEAIPGTELFQSTASAISASTTPANIVYYGSNTGELFRIDNTLDPTPQVSSIRSGEFPENGYIISIAIDRTNADKVMVAFSNYNVKSIFYSENGGATFEHVSGNLEEFEDGSGSGPSVRWVDIFPKSDGGYLYFAATSTGLYSTENLDGNNTIWTQEGASEIGNLVSVMVKHRPADGAVILGTHGGGIYTAHFDDAAPLPGHTIAEKVSIGPAFPNPFFEKTTIPYFLPEDGPARIKILTLNGQLVKTLLWSHHYAGKNFITWDGTNEGGILQAEGVYLCELEYGRSKYAAKLVYRRR